MPAQAMHFWICNVPMEEHRDIFFSRYGLPPIPPKLGTLQPIRYRSLETNFFGCGRLFPPALSNISEMFRHLTAAFLIGDEGWRASSSTQKLFPTNDNLTGLCFCGGWRGLDVSERTVPAHWS